MTASNVLDLGCGGRKIKGAVGLDRVAVTDVDVVHDLNVFPYPFKDSCFEKIYMRHIVEHVDNVLELMREAHRITKPGGIVEIDTPHFSSNNSYIDPTHKHHFSLLTFDFFCGKTEHSHVLGSATPLYRLVDRQVTFWPIHEQWEWASYKIVGMKWLAERHPVFFERFLSFIFTIKEFRVRLQVLK